MKLKLHSSETKTCKESTDGALTLYLQQHVQQQGQMGERITSNNLWGKVVLQVYIVCTADHNIFEVWSSNAVHQTPQLLNVYKYAHLAARCIFRRLYMTIHCLPEQKYCFFVWSATSGSIKHTITTFRQWFLRSRQESTHLLPSPVNLMMMEENIWYTEIATSFLLMEICTQLTVAHYG